MRENTNKPLVRSPSTTTDSRQNLGGNVYYSGPDSDTDPMLEIDSWNSTGPISKLEQGYTPLSSNIIHTCSSCGCYLMSSRKKCATCTKRDPIKKKKVRTEKQTLYKNEMILNRKDIAIVTRRKLINKMSQFPKLDFYWVCESKVINNIEKVIDLLHEGKTVFWHQRLKGGMKRIKDDMTLYLKNARGELKDDKRVNNQKRIQREFIKNEIQKGIQVHQQHQINNVKQKSYNGLHYHSKYPKYEKDPSWIENKKSTAFEDQMEYMRHALVNHEHRVNMLNKDNNAELTPVAHAGCINVMCHWYTQNMKMWLPPPKYYCEKFDYACEVEGNTLFYYFPWNGTYKQIAVTNCLHPTRDSMYIFTEHVWAPNETLYEPNYINVPHYLNGSQEVVQVPAFLVQKAVEYFMDVPVTNYNINKFLRQMSLLYKTTALQNIDLPSTLEFQCSIFHAARTKVSAMNEVLQINVDVLKIQNENTEILLKPQKNKGLWSILEWFLSRFIPTELMEYIKEWLASLRFTGLRGLWKEYNPTALILKWIDICPSPFKLFPHMTNLDNAFIEQLIKLVPGMGLVIAGIEITRDRNLLTWGQIIEKLIFHNLQELIPLPIRPFLLPVTTFIHWGIDTLKDWFRLKPKKKREWVTKIYPEHGNRREPPAEVFKIVDNLQGFKRFNESEAVEIPLDNINLNVLEHWKTDTQPKSDNPVFITANAMVGNVAGNPTMNNLVSAYYKRNAQARPLDQISSATKKSYYSAAKTMVNLMNYEHIDTLEWINKPNHGSKIKLYTDAYDRVLKGEPIDFRAKLNLKMDEILFKPMMRTICAFDNTYLVSVAPALNAVANALKKIWDGYTNVSNDQRFTLHILYADGKSAETISRITTWNTTHKNLDGRPHYFLKVLGDDSALYRELKSLACDFSRYDSTQHKFQHSMVRYIIGKLAGNEISDLLDKAASAPLYMNHYHSKNKLKVSQNGLKTGCPETSLSNTILTGISYLVALSNYHDSLEDDISFEESIVDTLKNKCGFLPKPVSMNLQTGVEFLKTIFILQDDKVVALPLLSIFGKLGKSLTDPLILMKQYKTLTYPQKCLEVTYAQLQSRGNLHFIDGYSTLMRSFQSKSTKKMSMKSLIALKRHGLQFEGSMNVTSDTVSTAYEHRYGVTYNTFQSFINSFCRVHVNHYPFSYTSTIINKAVEKDYDIQLN